jgi:alpha-tubulin suppressor-like RCC1 family protein
MNAMTCRLHSLRQVQPYCQSNVGVTRLRLIRAWTVLLMCGCLAVHLSAAGLQQMHDQLPRVAANLTPIGRLAATQHLRLALGLPLRNQAALSNLLQQIYDPASTNYHRFLTPQQFADQFGPTPEDYALVEAFARGNGLAVSARHPNRVLLDVEGSAADIEKALHVHLNSYQHPEEPRTFYAPDTEPSLDLAVPLAGISGLDNYGLPRPLVKVKPLTQAPGGVWNTGTGPGGTYMGKDFRNVYAPVVELSGSGQSVGLVEFDGYAASDITAYENESGLPNVPLVNVLLDGSDGRPHDGSEDTEVALDIEMAIAMAPGLSNVIVYMAGSENNFDDLLNRMAIDNAAKQLSCSWYIPYSRSDSTADGIFQQMAAQGQSFLNASGDSGAYASGQLIPFPGDNPYITQVGGTTLTTTVLFGFSGVVWGSETAWNDGGHATGGGSSTQYPIPGWQAPVSMAANYGSTTMRNTPDVALTADNIDVYVGGEDQAVGGTSCAAPLWAGFTALINQQAAQNGRPPVGFLNPAIYAIGLGPNYGQAFHDITTGNNGSPTLFPAVAGYDLCTGWGTPVGQQTIDAFEPPDFLIITPNSGFTSTGPVGGPFSVTSQTLTLANRGTTSLNWAVNTSTLPSWLTVSPTSGTLPSGGSPATVAVSLNSAAASLGPGTYTGTVQITDQSRNYTFSLPYTLNVIAAPIISLQPASQLVPEGGQAAFTVMASGEQLSYQWYFNGNPLTDNGHITGSATVTLSINNVSTGDAGNYTVTISDLTGSVTSSTATLTVIPPPTCNPAPSGLLAWWRFEGNLDDVFGQHNASTLDGSPAYVAGKVGQALSFNGLYAADIPFNLDLGQGSGFTTECWVNPSDPITSKEPVLSCPAAGGSQFFSIRINPPGQLAAILSSSSGAIYSIQSAVNSIVPNQFQHVALTYDAVSGTAVLYLNGQQAAAPQVLTPAMFPSNTPYAIFFGIDSGRTEFGSDLGSTALFLGLIDEVSLYSRPLSAAEIQADYNADFSGKCLPLITSQPQNQLVPAGGPATFSVSAIAGSGSLSYQWYYNGTAILGATQPTYTISRSVPLDAGQYSVVVSDATSTTLSASATLTVTTGSAAGGYWHSLAIKPNGTVKAWGQNVDGQVGDGTLTQRNSPVPVSGPTGIKMVAAGGYHSLALGQNGNAWAWGANASGQIGGPYYTYGSSYVESPVQVSESTVPLTNIVYIAGGAANSYAVRGNGTLWAWGDNTYGELGNGRFGGSVPAPEQVPGLSGVCTVAAGVYHVLALTTAGTVYSWGGNSYGELGNGTVNESATPTLIPNLSNIVAISAGGYDSYALDSSGTVWVWGSGAAGQLGLGTSTDSHVPAANTLLPGSLSTGTYIVGISSGYTFFQALVSDGTLRAWGSNGPGQLGDGTTTQRFSPVAISFPDGSQAVGIATGDEHTLSIQTDGTLRSWGANNYGQLGRNITGYSPTPGAVTGF